MRIGDDHFNKWVNGLFPADWLEMATHWRERKELKSFGSFVLEEYSKNNRVQQNLETFLDAVVSITPNPIDVYQEMKKRLAVRPNIQEPLGQLMSIMSYRDFKGDVEACIAANRIDNDEKKNILRSWFKAFEKMSETELADYAWKVIHVDESLDNIEKQRRGTK